MTTQAGVDSPSTADSESAWTQGMTGRESSDIVLIDVDAKPLVRTTTKVRYLALSYVWDRVQQFYATKANISELMDNGALHGYLDTSV
ncbi:het-domain-containing protein, partial [Fusarium denticulatum]